MTGISAIRVIVVCGVLILCVLGIVSCASQSVDSPRKGTAREGEWSNWVDVTVRGCEVAQNSVLSVPVTITTTEAAVDALERVGPGPVGTEQTQDVDAEGTVSGTGL